MNNYNSYKEAEETIIGGAHETMRSDVSDGLTGQEYFIEKCFIISIPHTFYMIADHDTQEVMVDAVRQGHQT